MNFEVTEGPFAHVEWLLGAVIGEEALSELFVFHLTVASHSPSIIGASYADLQDGLVGRRISLSMHAEDKVRYGIIASMEVEAAQEHAGGVMLRLVMRPRAWLLTLRKNTRIFQSKYVHQIVSTVLTGAGICHRWSLQQTYPKRVLCTQYEETDYAFVARILAEEGIYWFFEQASAFAPTATPAGEGSSTLSTVASAAGAVGAILGGLTGPAEDSGLVGGSTVGAIGVVGSLASIVGDAATVPVDPEADDPISGTTGQGGPAATHSLELFVFADTVVGYMPGGASEIDRRTSTSPPAHAPDRAHALHLRYGASTTGFVTNSVTSLVGVRTVGTTSVEIRDYNFRRPMALLSKVLEVGTTSALPALEFYEHHGEYEKPDIEDEQVRTRLEQLRANTSLVKGESTSPRMSPGCVVDLTQAPLPFHDGQFVPVKVSHEAYLNELGPAASRTADPSELRLVEAMASLLRDLEGTRRSLGEGELRALARRALGSTGSVPKTYQNRFEWAFASAVHRPQLPPRIRHAVNESAVVVGPAGQAIYVDNYGRVKVQFHWDREHAYNENSSCWIRVLSTWAGAGYGFQFLPRVGMEVVVTFLGGDPDRPVISGTVYNATHPTPEPLPQRSTRSGMRSQTVPGGGGFNELSFEDAQGVERVFIHAQKDLHEIVNDAHTTTVLGPQTTTVGGTQKAGVAENRIAAIGGNDSEIVGRNKAAHVGGNRVAEVAKNSSDLVHGDATREVRGVSIAEHVSDELRVVRGDSNLTVHGHQVVHVVNKTGGPKSTSTTYIDGSSHHTATDRVVIRSQHSDASATSSSIRLECGETFIELTGEQITLSAKNIKLKSTDNFTLDGKNVEVSGSDHIKLARSTAAIELASAGFKVGGVTKAELATSSSKLTLDRACAMLVGSTEAVVKGAKVKLESGSASDSTKDTSGNQDTPQTQTKRLWMAFGHPHGTEAFEPIRGADYLITSDGLAHEGTTDGDGAIDVKVPEAMTSATVVIFAHKVSDYKTRYTEPLTFQVHIESDFHAASDPRGARLRLRNLGYAPGVQTELTSLEDDPSTVQAIEAFQRDEGIRISGKLEEDETATTLNTVFGDV